MNEWYFFESMLALDPSESYTLAAESKASELSYDFPVARVNDNGFIVDPQWTEWFASIGRSR